MKNYLKLIFAGLLFISQTSIAQTTFYKSISLEKSRVSEVSEIIETDAKSIPITYHETKRFVHENNSKFKEYQVYLNKYEVEGFRIIQRNNQDGTFLYHGMVPINLNQAVFITDETNPDTKEVKDRIISALNKEALKHKNIRSEAKVSDFELTEVKKFYFPFPDSEIFTLSTVYRIESSLFLPYEIYFSNNGAHFKIIPKFFDHSDIMPDNVQSNMSPEEMCDMEYQNVLNAQKIIRLQNSTNNGSTIVPLESIPLPTFQGYGETIYNDIQSFGTERLEDEQYVLNDNTLGIITLNALEETGWGAVNYTSNDNVWQNTFIDGGHHALNVATQAHWGLSIVLKHFKSKYGIHLWGPQYEHNEITQYCNFHGADYPNANYNNWNTPILYYGNGYISSDGTQNHPFTALDIVAHEYAHGLTDHTVGLSYANNETGAINEAIGDMIGISVTASYSSDNYKIWTLGEDLLDENYPPSIEFLRSASSPWTYRHPKNYRGKYWDHTELNHHNNGNFMSHWFYLLSVGQTGENESGCSYSLEGISIHRAEEILIHAMRNYMVPSSSYSNFAMATLMSADDLFGGDGKQAAQDAWRAVDFCFWENNDCGCWSGRPANSQNENAHSNNNFISNDLLIDKYLDFAVFPNPSNSIISIEGFENRKVNIHLVNLLGQKISIAHEVEFLGVKNYNVIDMNSGVYILQISDEYENILSAKKLIITD